MRYQLPNGQLIGEYQAFTYADIQYPENWIALSTPKERSALGLIAVPDPVRADDTFYSNGDLNTPKPVSDIKTLLKSRLKATAYSLLSPSDYKIVRQIETGESADQPTLTYRAAVRTAYQSHKASVDQAATVDDLAALQFAWPQDAAPT